MSKNGYRRPWCIGNGWHPKHPGAVALGKTPHGLLTAEERRELSAKAGKRRLKTIPKARRREIAKKAAAARWGNKGK